MTEDVEGGRKMSTHGCAHYKVSALISGVRQAEPINFPGTMKTAAAILESRYHRFPVRLSVESLSFPPQQQQDRGCREPEK